MTGSAVLADAGHAAATERGAAVAATGDASMKDME